MKITAAPAGENAVILYLPAPVRPEYPLLLQTLAAQLRAQFPAIRDIVPSYLSLLIVMENPDCSALCEAAGAIAAQAGAKAAKTAVITIPVCYDEAYAPDLAALAKSKNMTAAEVIALHSTKTYDCYAIGFIPGFAFLGWLDERIAAPRLPQPKPVAAGSVGIAGRQTGIYPLASPGGWHIIGRTPAVLYAPEQNHFGSITCGQRVRFAPISAAEFTARSGELL